MIRFLRAWRRLYWHFRWVFFLCLIITVWGWRKSYVLPEPRELEIDFEAQPIQSVATIPDFNFEWKGALYSIFPRANYYLRGLVVSHNNVGGITDAYHSANAVDLKDLCVVWGENAQEGYYKNVDFWSEPWSCHYQFKKGQSEFIGQEMSNNHMLAGTQQIANDIRSTRIGDQIELSGYLIDYAPSNEPLQIRKTSLTREDTGDGACEVIFVTEYRIVKPANKEWREIAANGTGGLLVLTLFLLLSWTVLPVMEYRWGL